MNIITPPRAGPSARAAPWARLTLLALAVPQLLTGLWAVANPEGWYRTFPGFGPMLVAAEPPFNAHLATDAGAGFVATGVVAAVAAVWGERRTVLLAAVTLAAFALPHLYFHATQPAEALTTTQNTANVTALALAALLPLAVAFSARGNTMAQKGHKTS